MEARGRTKNRSFAEQSHALTCYEVGIAAGLNAGMWSIAVTKSGNAVGLSQQEIESLEFGQRAERLRCAYEHLHKCGAHYVIDTVADLPQVLERIEARLASGERP